MRMGILFGLFTALAFSGTITGDLVDANCYRSELDNVGPGQSVTLVGRDMASSVRYCSPNAKTRTFSVVQGDWTPLRLDAGGNAKAADLVGKSAKKRVFEVLVTGRIERNTLQVESIAASK